jgi:hypothetical protein
MIPQAWDKGFSIDSLAAACTFVESVWSEERATPTRLHSRGVQPRDLSGSPRWSNQFSHYVFASPDEIVDETSTDRGVVDTRTFYRYPLWRALSLLERRDHDRWTKGVPRRPFHPTPVSVLRALALANFDPKRVGLRYSDGTRIPPDMAELFAVGAARKLRSVYVETYVGWVEKSDSQKSAEGEAA